MFYINVYQKSRRCIYFLAIFFIKGKTKKQINVLCRGMAPKTM